MTTACSLALGIDETATSLAKTSTTSYRGREDETILVVGHWQYIGRGHSPGEAIYARTIAHDLAESRRLARHAVADDAYLCEGAP